MRVKDLPEKTKGHLLSMLDAPDHVVKYNGSGMREGLRARLVSAGWAERAELEGKEAVRLTEMGIVVAKKLKGG